MGDHALKGKVIAQILPELNAGGVERTCVEVTEALVHVGAKPVVASAGGRLVSDIEKLGGQHFELPLKTKNPFKIKSNKVKLIKLAKQESIALFHARSRAPGWSTYWAAGQLDLPFVTTYHGHYSEGFPFKKLYNSVMARGSIVIANSNFTAAHVLERHARLKPNIEVIHRGVDLDKFNKDKITKAASDKAKAHLPGYDAAKAQSLPILLLPGRLTAWKGQSIFIEALSKLKNEGLLYKAYIVGDAQGRDDYVATLKALINDHDLSDHIALCGHFRDMAALMALSDIVVAPSIRPEAFGRVAAEAGAMQKIAIAFNHGGQCEIIDDGKTGFLARPGDLDSLADKLKAAVLMDQGTRLKFQKNALHKVSSTFSKKALQASTLDVYVKLLT